MIIDKINKFHKSIMYELWDLGRVGYERNFDDFKNEIASICRSYLIELYSELKRLGVIKGKLKTEYDVQSFDESKITKKELLKLIEIVYITSSKSFLNKINSLSQYAFNSNNVIEFGDEEIKEYENVPNAEAYYFNIRAGEIVVKKIRDFDKDVKF